MSLLSTFMSVHHVHARCLSKAQKGFKSQRTLFRDNCEPLCVCPRNKPQSWKNKQ